MSVFSHELGNSVDAKGLRTLYKFYFDIYPLAIQIF